MGHIPKSVDRSEADLEQDPAKRKIPHNPAAPPPEISIVAEKPSDLVHAADEARVLAEEFCAPVAEVSQ